MKHSILILILIFALVSCKNEPKNSSKTSTKEVFEDYAVTGNYVSDGYNKRNEGYDWVSVSVTETENDKLAIKIRSRADLKKPSCTFDAEAQKVNDSTYETSIEGKSILFQFSEKVLSISTQNEADKDILNLYCSGGASIAGTYKKIEETLDQSQIDKTQFGKVLHLQDVGFNVSSIAEGKNNRLTIFTFGLPNDYSETFDIGTHEITSAEVEDLNADGSPELIVFARSTDSLNKITVYGFSVNNKTSMSQVYFQPTEENKEISNGYNGNDEFALVERYLVQRFPIYKNGKETGTIKQIQYQLVDGEATRKFEVAKQSEYDLN